MKTDRFTDIIRRKLESIRPEFTEKDWTRMQATLRQAAPQPSDSPQAGAPGAGQPFSGGIWLAQPWLLAAATVSTVLLIAFSVWQRREINHLRGTIGQLTEHPSAQPVTKSTAADTPASNSPTVAHTDGGSRAEQNPAFSSSKPQAGAPSIQRDTVYITRYGTVPSHDQVDGATSNRVAKRTETPPDRLPSVATTATDPAGQSKNTINNPKTESYDAPSTPSYGNKTINTESLTASKPTGRATKESIGDGRNAKNQSLKSGSTSPANSIEPPVNTQPINLATPAERVTETGAAIELIGSRPLSTEGINWQAALAHRAKSLRPARTTPVVEQRANQTPESQPANPTSIRFRAGVGGELASRLVSTGVFTEVLVGKHWVLGVGFGQTAYNGTFINDYDFYVRTRRDFRREYARGLDPKRDILNIDTRATRLQIPLHLGYRIPLTQTLTVSTTVGTYLNLAGAETGTFYSPVFIPQRGFDEHTFSTSPSVDLITSFVIGAGLEWQRGHWVVQASPVLTLPVQADPTPMQPDPNWQKNTTVGLRARLMFQF
ncbi:hypothetical protein [Spirosoma areae]